MRRFSSKMTAMFLCASALAGCASAGTDIAKLTGGDTASGHAKKEVATAKVDKTMPTDLEGGVRQAQLMRYAGQYDDAIRVLSQLMLVASDDPRVVSEYGKTLVEKGRAQDAAEFLNRAIELSSKDWTLYSALGVSYDQLGNQPAARTAYEHALALHPEEPSVLNNYALSRMLAGDADAARVLIGRAQAAGGASDSKIAANIALLNKLAPQPVAPQNAALTQKPAAVKQVASIEPITASNPPELAVPHPIVPSLPPVAQAAPRSLVSGPPPGAQAAPLPGVAAPRPVVSSLPPVVQPKPQPAASPLIPSGVVMQAVPFDPYAGPVALHSPSTAAVAPIPGSKQAAVQAATPDSKAAAKTDPKPGPKTDANIATPKPAVTPAPVKTVVKTADANAAATPAPVKPVVKTADANAAAAPKPDSKQAAAVPPVIVIDHGAKPADAKPAAAPKIDSNKTDSKQTAAQLVPPVIVIDRGAKTADAKAAAAPKPDSKQATAELAPPVIVIDYGAKTDAKPAPVKTAAKDQVPALRLTADARSP